MVRRLSADGRIGEGLRDDFRSVCLSRISSPSPRALSWISANHCTQTQPIPHVKCRLDSGSGAEMREFPGLATAHPVHEGVLGTSATSLVDWNCSAARPLKLYTPSRDVGSCP